MLLHETYAIGQGSTFRNKCLYYVAGLLFADFAILFNALFRVTIKKNLAVDESVSILHYGFRVAGQRRDGDYFQF